MSLRPSIPLRIPKSPSSSTWLSRQSRDPYVKQRLMYRSRSAFKLLDLDAKYGGFLGKRDVRAIVDLGAAPGGWSQVVAGKLGLLNRPQQDNITDDDRFGVAASVHDASKRSGRGKDKLVVAVDLLKMNPIPGVKILQGNMLAPQTSVLIKNLLTRPGNPEGKADVVLSDMAANMTGNRIADSENSLDICNAVFAFTKGHLRSAESVGRRRGGVLVLKHFAHPLMTQFRKECLDPNFADVAYVKPDSSRSESSEGYWICMGWKGLDPKHEDSES